MQKTIYGYIRVSTKDQNEDRQMIDLLAYGVDSKNIFMDKLSGKDFNRPAYQLLVHHQLKKGDVLIVKSIDRLGRNYSEILSEWRYITKERGADIKIIDMPLLDTQQDRDLIGTLISDIVLQLLSFVAENERINIRQRQAEGIAAAKARGVHMGRPPAKIPDHFLEVYQMWDNKEIDYKQASKLLNISNDAFYRLVKKHRAAL